VPFHGGLDWGGSAHAVCVVDAAGQVAARIEARHDAAGLADLLARLRKIAPAAELPIAIERPSGLIVDALIEAGHPVVPIHPNVVKACRPRYRAAGGKSDPGDAYMLADILRTDGHRFRPLTPLSDDIRALRALVRGRDDLVAQRVALANQLRSLLEGFWPGAAAIFAAVDSPIALAFVGRYPTPDSVTRLGEKRLAGFMAQHGYCGRRSPAELLARLRAAPLGLAGDAEAEAKGEIARTLAGLLERLVAAIAKLSSRIEHAVAELPDGRIVMSFPRAGRVCAAQILAELGDVRERFPTEGQLAAEAGVCPVTAPRAGAAASPSDGPATRARGPPSPASPTTPGTPRSGQPASTARPAHAAASTSTPSAPAPASSGRPRDGRPDRGGRGA
jgi:transposase